MSDIRAFKREHQLAPPDEGEDTGPGPGLPHDEPDLRAEDEALVAAALEAEREAEEEAAEAEPPTGAEATAAEPESELEDAAAEEGERPRARRRGRRGGRGRRRRREGRTLEGTFDHGEEGYGLWLDPAVQDDPVYAEHWAGHRPVTVTVEPERIVIMRAGEDGAEDGEDEGN